MRALLLIASVMLFSSTAGAVKYMKLEEAVKKFIPKDAKILKVTKTPSADDRKRLLDDYGWEATEAEYVTYKGVDKADENKVLGYVFVVPEIFNTCFHKYAIGVSAEGKILEAVIIELTCPRSFPIAKKAFLAQFKEKSKRRRHSLTRPSGNTKQVSTNTPFGSEPEALLRGREPLLLDAEKARLDPRTRTGMPCALLEFSI